MNDCSAISHRVSGAVRKLPGVQGRLFILCYFVVPMLSVALLALSSLSCQTSDLLPSELGGLRRMAHEDGGRASEIINAMHGKGVTPKENLIGVYRGTGATAVLYISVFQTEQQSRTEFLAMAAAIGAGNPVFTRCRSVEIEGRQMSCCSGMDQAHYFFSAGGRLFWLAVDSTVAERSARALVRFAYGEGGVSTK